MCLLQFGKTAQSPRSVSSLRELVQHVSHPSRTWGRRGASNINRPGKEEQSAAHMEDPVLIHRAYGGLRAVEGCGAVPWVTVLLLITGWPCRSSVC